MGTGGGDNVRMLVPITDPEDGRIADYRALTDVELRTRWEPPHGLFIAEGELVVRRALRAGYRLRSVLVDAKRADDFADLAPVYAATQDVLERATGFHVHRGVGDRHLAHVGRPERAAVQSGCVLDGWRRRKLTTAQTLVSDTGYRRCTAGAE
jgi:hypothetical protein